MKYDEVWSYPVDRISEYFMSRGAISHGSACSIDGVVIQLLALEERMVGPLNLPQTRVIISGDSDADVEKVYHAFYLNFLSGGA